MWIILVFIVVAAAAAYVIYRRMGSGSLPKDTYVCDLCGERHCICHLEEKK